MPPKKKGNKKAADDWDEGLGETADPIAAATQAAKEADAKDDAEEETEVGGGGGLLTALKKNRNKKQKKGKVVEDFVEGEDPPGMDGVEENDVQTPQEDLLAAKAPEEANIEDEFDELPAKKGKGGKKGANGKLTPKAAPTPPPEPEPEQLPEADDDEGDVADEDDGGRIKTKKEKEKEKKEREKARKKEQVWLQ